MRKTVAIRCFVGLVAAVAYTQGLAQVFPPKAITKSFLVPKASSVVVVPALPDCGVSTVLWEKVQYAGSAIVGGNGYFHCAAEETDPATFDRVYSISGASSTAPNEFWVQHKCQSDYIFTNQQPTSGGSSLYVTVTYVEGELSGEAEIFGEKTPKQLFPPDALTRSVLVPGAGDFDVVPNRPDDSPITVLWEKVQFTQGVISGSNGFFSCQYPHDPAEEEHVYPLSGATSTEFWVNHPCPNEYSFINQQPGGPPPFGGTPIYVTVTYVPR